MIQVRHKLFRITRHRSILLGDVITTLRMEIEAKDGFERLLIQECSGANRETELAELEERLKHLKRLSDVIRTVAYHEDDINLKFLRYNEKTWRNEWDIPLELFNEAFDFAIQKIEEHKQLIRKKQWIKNCDLQIALLKQIKEYRNDSHKAG